MGHYKYKQVIIIRRDLKMRRGKEIAQGSHASMGAYFEAKRLCAELADIYDYISPYDNRYWVANSEWLNNGFAKICVQVDNEEEMIYLYKKIKEAGIPVALITDSGKTEFNGVPTNTCVGVGPYLAEEIDKFTGHLKLY